MTIFLFCCDNVIVRHTGRFCYLLAYLLFGVNAEEFYRHFTDFEPAGNNYSTTDRAHSLVSVTKPGFTCETVDNWCEVWKGMESMGVRGNNAAEQF